LGNYLYSKLDSDPDLLVKILDADPAKRFGSDQIRISNIMGRIEMVDLHFVALD
jgi:hypothetical protein